ncbi:winged helix-turn-helix transcriptional regulator [Brevibacterium sp. UCMA 11752]|uniref:winged helix-turn-helix transcriptional regulator n=1 Tax=Brevibacterium sp. UCMA 11752 TaxID=2745946 RepID=UPI001F461C0A|nr:helix-turn-helix domain-containing protein [Brevibacterium sp. UCMA 11752]MCF2587105.1 helix-turn-helix transcriptional regulator [Brevibacterium sp. UCMA 11752]
MDWLDFDTADCSIQKTLDIIGEKWTVLILREAFNGVRRFDQIRDHVGVSDPVLSDRLRKLVTAGVLAVKPYREVGQRARKEYRLTDKGLDLYPVMISLLRWGDKHGSGQNVGSGGGQDVGPGGPQLEVLHRDCGEPVNAIVECAAGHPISSPRESVTRMSDADRSRAS